MAGDPHFANVILLCHFDGADASTTFTDFSPIARTLTAVNNAQVDTAQSQWGGASGLFDGTNDSIEAADSADWLLFSSSADEFTVEAWVRTPIPSGDIQVVCGQRSLALSSLFAWSLRIMTDGTLSFGYRTSGGTNVFIEAGATKVTSNTWHHVAVDKNSSGVFRLYIDGVMVDTSTPATQTMTNPSITFRIGANANDTQDFAGHIDDLRITKGVARYNSDSGYTVPTEAFPDTADVPADTQVSQLALLTLGSTMPTLSVSQMAALSLVRIPGRRIQTLVD